MAYCPDCGAEVDAEATFCESCGANLEESATGGSAEADVPSDTDSDIAHPGDGGINWKWVGIAGVFALLPAFGAYFLLSIAANSPNVVVFLIALPIFGYLLYQRPTVKSIAGGTSFWLAVELFLLPFFTLLYTAAFAAQETSTAAGEAGAAIGGTFLIILEFLVGFPLAIGLYILSRRWEHDESD